MKEWDSQLVTHSDKKLRCYIAFKQTFGQEKYLSIKNYLSREDLHIFAYLPTDLT